MLPRYARRELIWTIIIIAVLFLVFAPDSAPAQMFHAIGSWLLGLAQKALNHFQGA